MKFYKYYRFEKIYDFAPLENRTIRFSSPVFFNDIYDCLCVQRNEDGLFKYDFKETIGDTFHIACFSRNPNSPIMWSHYASNHQGYIIEYDYELPNLVDIQYKEITPPMFDTKKIKNDLYRKFPNLDESEFESYLLKYLTSGDFLRSTISKSIYVKHSDWKYEEELRAVVLNTSNNTKGYSDLEISPSCIKSIILGSRFDLEKYKSKLQTIKRNLYNNTLSIYSAFPRLDKYYITFKEVEL